MPTVKFHPSRVNQEVMRDLESHIALLSDIPRPFGRKLNEAALDSIRRGRDLGSLTAAILSFDIEGIDRRRSADISGILHKRASALMQNQKMLDAGIKYAIWMYAGAPCIVPGEKDRYAEQDAAHQAANGKKYAVSKGLYLNAKWTWPGFEAGCKCVSKPVVNGFS